MPITIVGNAFGEAWEKKQIIEVSMRMRDLLEDRGLGAKDVQKVFEEFDATGDGNLDLFEFRSAMDTLKIDMPWDKLKRLFHLYDSDNSGAAFVARGPHSPCRGHPKILVCRPT